MYKDEYQKQTEVNKKGFWGIWSLITIGDYPKDFCALFWNTFLSIITLPLWIVPGIFVNGIAAWKNKYHEAPYFIWVFLNFLSLCIGAIAMNNQKLSESLLIALGTLSLTGWGIMICMLIMIAIVLGIFWLIEKVKTLIKSNTNISSHANTHVVKHFFHDFKAKHCTFINWK